MTPTKIRYLLITVVLSLSVACGVAALPAEVSKISPTSEITPTVAQKQPILATPQPSQVISPVLCVSATKSLNLRVAPSTMAEGLGVLYHGVRVSVLGTGAGWLKVETEDGRQGWVKAEYIGGCNE